MEVLFKEAIEQLAERNGWSLDHAEGYLHGEAFRRSGKTPSPYAQVGIDDYCRGFRAGYYERQNIDRSTTTSIASLSGQPIVPLS